MLIDLSLIAVFIGQNNSGKSNVLDAIEFALSGALDNEQIYYANADLEIYLEFDEQEVKRHQLPDKEGVFILQNQERKIVFKEKELAYNQSLKIILSSSVKRLDEAAFFDIKQIEMDWHSLQRYPANLEKFKDSLKRHFAKISARENALDINYGHDGLYEGQRRVTIDRLGSGFFRIFTMLLYVFHPNYSVVMVDEPETHLHPAMIKKLLWAMQNSWAGQILFSTHSPLFITPATLPQLVRVVKEGKSTLAFTLDKKVYNNYQRLLQELNADNLEMFFADKVLLVEGVSDRLLMRGLIDRFYHGQKEIKVIQTHGKGNTNIYLDLLRSFAIDFAIMLDNDALKNNYIDSLTEHLGIHLPPLNSSELVVQLKNNNIFIFSKGALESHYPRSYQNDNSKSLNALRAASLISKNEFESKIMSEIKEIIDNL